MQITAKFYGKAHMYLYTTFPDSFDNFPLIPTKLHATYSSNGGILAIKFLLPPAIINFWGCLKFSQHNGHVGH